MPLLSYAGSLCLVCSIVSAVIQSIHRLWGGEADRKRTHLMAEKTLNRYFRGRGRFGWPHRAQSVNLAYVGNSALSLIWNESFGRSASIENISQGTASGPWNVFVEDLGVSQVVWEDGSIWSSSMLDGRLGKLVNVLNVEWVVPCLYNALWASDLSGWHDSLNWSVGKMFLSVFSPQLHRFLSNVEAIWPTRRGGLISFLSRQTGCEVYVKGNLDYN